MPELPEVETVIRKISFVKGKVIKNVEVFKENLIKCGTQKDIFISSLRGEIVKEIERKGKNIFFIFNKYVLVNHLRMTGKYFFDSFNFNFKSLALKFSFEDGSELFFCDTRNFATFHLQKLNNYKDIYPYNKIGFDLIQDNIVEDNIKFFNIFNAFKKKKIPIKAALLEQEIISGIGNIYASEILFDVKINPLSLTNLLTKNDLKRIIDSSKKILSKAIDLGGTSVFDFVSPDNEKGRFQNELKVYERLGKKCFVCNENIERIFIDKRSTFFCSFCQKIKIIK